MGDPEVSTASHLLHQDIHYSFLRTSFLNTDLQKSRMGGLDLHCSLDYCCLVRKYFRMHSRFLFLGQKPARLVRTGSTEEHRIHRRCPFFCGRRLHSLHACSYALATAIESQAQDRPDCYLPCRSFVSAAGLLSFPMRLSSDSGSI
jgi:hypothetical protein